MKFDSTGDDAWYKVKLPNVTAATDVLVYIYYGKSDATTDDDIPNTLESDVLACWPLDLNAPGGAFADIASTNDGTNTGTTDTAGQVSRARAFSGTGQYISCGTGLAVSGARTIKASINGVHGAASLHAVLAKYGAASASVHDFYLAVYQQKLRALLTGPATPVPLAKITNGATTLADNTNYLIGMSWDNGNQANHLKVWLDGVDDSSTYADEGEFTVGLATAEPVLIGARNSASPLSLYQGWIDETVYYSSVKSADWWKVENASVKGLWGSAGTPEALNFTHSPDGGFVVGGAAQHTFGYTYTPDGGFVVGGEADVTYFPTFTQYPSGGFVIGGAAEHTIGLTITPAGGFVVGGQADVAFASPITTVPFVWRIVNPITRVPVTGDEANTRS